MMLTKRPRSHLLHPLVDPTYEYVLQLLSVELQKSEGRLELPLLQLVMIDSSVNSSQQSGSSSMALD